MSISDEFAVYVCDQLSGWGEVTVRKMFGGAGLYRDGVMFGLIAEDTVYLKVDNSNRKDFEAAGMSPFRPDADKKMTMPYYEVPADVLEEAALFCAWAEKAHRVAVRRKA